MLLKINVVLNKYYDLVQIIEHAKDMVKAYWSKYVEFSHYKDSEY